ncbi:multiprotein-bridging factor 1 family protein [Microtetraspora fusca]|uniref:Multiprotein-bridging factor 1 family protein n=1 Tax=Microtetraspora fusca TaxID=1997 RepID=A0ABW6UYJ6_MICFU
MVYQEFGHILRKARAAKGLQQHDVARHVGTSQSTVSQWERGLKIPQGSQAQKLAHVLAIPMGDLYNAVLQSADPVELAIVRSDLSRREQDLMLLLYGHFADRDSLDNVLILRLPQDEPPEDDTKTAD